ncbi:hypothetical protein [Halomarina rubra]|uniref:Major facilitator superfamily (MFS) profile domain-containing protein n=1 Tax=Halomarina rubra TaxID=2071873 RepID=A0ABD6AYP5_9EURY|nr:hypothetical protein [Halomarina rubra]
MNGTVALTTVVGTVVGLAIVLYATYAHLGNVVVAAGGVVVLASVAVMTVAIASYEGDGATDHADHPE